MSLENVTAALSGDEHAGQAGAEAAGGRIWLRAFAGNRLAVAGLAVVILLTLFSFIGPLLYHTDQIHTRLSMETLAPGPGRPLGTDNVGYDQLGRLMVGGQTTLEVAFGAAAVAVVLGVLWGSAAGYLGGLVDGLMMRIVDALLAIPALLLLLFLATVFRPTVLILIIVVGLTAWLVPARLVRGETLTLRTREYVQAVKVAGGSGLRIVFRHIIPNAIGTILVNASFQIADAILFLATLGYLGLGIQPPGTDWGTMLSTALANGALQNDYWWEILAPGLAIMSAVVAFNFVGDGLRNAMEVRLRP